MLIDARAEHGVAIMNAHPRRLDMDWLMIPYALETCRPHCPDAYDCRLPRYSLRVYGRAERRIKVQIKTQQLFNQTDGGVCFPKRGRASKCGKCGIVRMRESGN
jgi:hypothetical protein